MSTIIAGRFSIQPQVSGAIEALHRAGFPADHISAFYVNPPGQHDLYRYGGDVDRSPGAEDTAKGAAGGIAAGAALGIAATPIVGIIGPLVGAYVGAFMGSMASTREKEELPDPNGPREHPSGMLVAVESDQPGRFDEAAEVLRAAGAFDLEVAQGHIEDGDWVDFDPREAPHMLRQH